MSKTLIPSVVSRARFTNDKMGLSAVRPTRFIHTTHRVNVSHTSVTFAEHPSRSVSHTSVTFCIRGLALSTTVKRAADARCLLLQLQLL